MQIKPGGYKYEPRTLTENPGQFGKSSIPLRPVASIDRLDPRFRAANLQHLIANAAREEILAQGLNLRSFLATLTPAPPGMTYERLVRIHRGETLMQLADIMAWAHHFDNVKNIVTSQITRPTDSSASAGERQGIEMPETVLGNSTASTAHTKP